MCAAGQAEHALADDVLHHLVGTARDVTGRCTEHRLRVARLARDRVQLELRVVRVNDRRIAMPQDRDHSPRQQGRQWVSVDRDELHAWRTSRDLGSETSTAGTCVDNAGRRLFEHPIDHRLHE